MTDAAHDERKGPLAGIRVLEFVGLGPGPHCTMLLADMGAEVIRFERPGGNGFPNAVLDRGRHVVTVDLKTEADRALCRRAAAKADVLVEGYRPGVMERLGLGPTDLMSDNPRLIYARLTGWGQDGPLASSAGHDITYISVAGALAHIRPVDGLPIPPLHLVGDYGGGSLYAVFGIAAALFERERSGRGQVIDSAIVDGVASTMSLYSGYVARGSMSTSPKANFMAGAAPFYRCYRCADGAEISVGPLEPHFFAQLLQRIGAPASYVESQYDVECWDEQSRVLTQIFAQKTREEWRQLLEGTDVCFAPVLTIEESYHHPHLRVRETYAQREGVWHCAPAPRFSRTPGAIQVGGDGGVLLKRWGVEQ